MEYMDETTLAHKHTSPWLIAFRIIFTIALVWCILFIFHNSLETSSISSARSHEVMRRHPLLLLDGCHNADGTAALAATLKEAGYDGNLVAVLGLLKDKDHSKMLENLAPCFEKVFTVTPDSPRAMTAEELEEEAKYHMDAEAAPSVAKAIRLAGDYADENNLAGVVVCGSLYLAAQARPLLLKEAEK